MVPQSLLDTDPEAFVSRWQTNCFGAFLCCRAVWPDMVAAKSGSIILTGATASLRGIAGMSSFSVGKMGLRSLAQTLTAEGAPLGVHVAHVIVDAPVDLPLLRKMTGRDATQLADPAHIAALYVHLIQQPPTCWTSEVDVHIQAKL